MKFNRRFVLGAALTMLLAVSYTTAKAKNYVAPKAYMFGFVASFNDSIVYFTDIQEVDSVWFTQKKDMLAGRSNYSGQLRSYCAYKLDQRRRSQLIGFITDKVQTFITVNDKALIPDFSSNSYFKVENGIVKEETDGRN